MTPPHRQPTTHPATFRVEAWPVDDLETIDALGPYAETFWLPILHPTAYVLGRRLVTLFHRARVADGETLQLEAPLIAHAIGVYERTDAEPSLAVYGRALRRLDRYKLIRIHKDSVAVKVRWPRLNPGLVSALSEPMQRAEPYYWATEAPLASEFIER